MSQIRAATNTNNDAKRLEQRIEQHRAQQKNAQADDLLNQTLQQKTPAKKSAVTTASVFQTESQEKKPFAEQRLLDNKYLHAPFIHAKQQVLIQKRDFDFNQQLQAFTSPDKDPKSIHAHDPLQNANASSNQVQSHQLSDYAKQPRTPIQQSDAKKESEPRASLAHQEKTSKKIIENAAPWAFWAWLKAVFMALWAYPHSAWRQFFGAQIGVKKSRLQKRYKAKLRYKMSRSALRDNLSI